MNGHIALNEPAPSLHTNCHVAHLSQKSLQHPMIAGDTEKPGYGLTLGMANIFQSRLIILLINGIKKRRLLKLSLNRRSRQVAGLLIVAAPERDLPDRQGSGA